MPLWRRIQDYPKVFAIVGWRYVSASDVFGIDAGDMGGGGGG
jgi:hypothetical protein